MYKIRVPSLAENVTTATLSSWLIKIGEHILPNTEVAAFITEKAEFTLQSDNGGIVSTLLAPEKSVLPVGYIIALLDATPEDELEAKLENDKIEADYQSSQNIQLDSLECTAASRAIHNSNIRATPAARRLAKEHQVDLYEVSKWLCTDKIIKDDDIQRFIDSGS